ncbi:MAG: hypothetical protein NTW86_31055 [Candidatus Sumerlaeota bacterium]|nr:hypothetical protein [Candidatus Sumerlaeota bacterium]
MFDDKFLDALPADPVKAAYAMCEHFLNWDKSHGSGADLRHYATYLDDFAALEVFMEATGLPFDAPSLGTDRLKNISVIQQCFHSVYTGYEGEMEVLRLEGALAEAREKYRGRFGKGFVFEFSDGDLERIQTLINDLRDRISSSELFDAKHKARVLAKLEALQRELHKKMSSLDSFWGLIGDAGVVLGKFGKDAKPLVDRMGEIAHIVWRTQARAEELPSASPFPLLSAPPEDRSQQKVISGEERQ